MIKFYAGLLSCTPLFCSQGLARMTWERELGAIRVPRCHCNCLSVLFCPWLDGGLPPQCQQVVWCHWGEIEPFSATLAEDDLAECGQSGKNPLKYSAMPRNWTREQWDTFILYLSLSYHDPDHREDSEIHSFSHWVIMTRATEGTASEIHSFAHWAIMTTSL